MSARPYRRLRARLSFLVVASFLAGTAWAAPAGADEEPSPFVELPPQEPGVTQRVYDVQQPLKTLCELKAGQTPNTDQLKQNVDWKEPGDFGGHADNFVSQTIGNIQVPEDGTYAFRLTSDDGSRLVIGNQRVIEHDGLHGPTPKDGTAELTAGHHALLIEHFEAGGEQQVTLSWRPPGASDFTVVPNSVLSTDAGVVRVTAPGRKECANSTESPGDGLPLNGVHPDYRLTDLRPKGFEPQVTAMDWLPDGRLAVSTWGGTDNTEGEVHLLDHVTGGTGPDKVTTEKVADGLKEPMGLKYVDGSLYVSQKHELTRLKDTDGDDVTDAYETVATWPFGKNFHEFAFGLLYRDGYFYLNLSVAIDYGGATTDPQPAKNRGTTVKVDRETGDVTYVAGGLRTPNGIGWGPGGDLFATDNQGGWLPSSKLLHVKQGRFFNHHTNPDGPFDDRPVTQPVLWLPQNEIGNSPSTPLLLKEGTFAGQMLIGDVTYGGVQRASLEKVGGEYQGAVFRFTQGLEAGVNRLSTGPDGALYAGGLGAGGNWGQPGKLKHGLQKLTPAADDAFDIKTMRATRTGFELEYTKPVSRATADKLAARYRVTQWRYVPTAAYGGPKVDEETLPVRAATLAADRRKVTLDIPGLKPGRVVHLRSPRPFTAEGGKELWSTEAWYTLNRIPGAGPAQQTLYEAEESRLEGGAGTNDNHSAYSGRGFVDGYGTKGAATTFDVTVKKGGTYDVGLRYANGPHPAAGTKTLTVHVNGREVRQTRLPSTGTWDRWSTRAERIELRAGANTITYRHGDGDTGHVNLDLLAVHPRGDTTTLFDGTDRSPWQHTDGRTPQWPLVGDRAMEVCCGDIRTKEAYQDFKLHVEFRLPKLPPDVTGQDRANSGVYLQERYEIQILDSYGDSTPADNEAGAVYTKRAPDKNAAKPPETWQTYDITFRAARFDDGGTKTQDARVTVVWNGVKVHDDVAIDGPTGGGDAESPAAGAIRLQDHRNAVRYRNISIQPL
ncbi:family 16 glycoside hydrolase [Streptomyces sp. NPDC017940]|uniref:family 16 glycoside hydrolase n=1 Tax=Streptomyces sp. NPDC017940 TaxID=3365017 RepID=UPI00378D1B39